MMWSSQIFTKALKPCNRNWWLIPIKSIGCSFIHDNCKGEKIEEFFLIKYFENTSII